MGRGDAAASTSKGTPRIRNKITHKTRLRLVHGDVLDAFPADDDHGDGKALATGVDAEDANEFHLLQVLAASQQASSSSAVFCQQQPSSRSAAPTTTAPTSKPTPTAAPLYIPTPDATGKVANYAEFYPDIGWEPPTLLAKASDTLEESMGDEILSAGYAYVMDERDDDWLERYNKEANGETTATPTKRSAKARGKEREASPPPPISEDDFELVMGLFERFTEQESPYLHMSPSDVPTFPEYEPFFANPLPPHFFPSFLIPDSVPDSPILVRFARSIYPHWRERKIERGGRRIIPQLNYDESNDSDPYVCFRRREVKPVRKTRRQDTSSIDKLQKLQDELKRVQQLAETVLDRENLKVAFTRTMKEVTEKRIKLVEMRRRAGPLVFSVNDDELFIDRNAMKRKEKADPNGPSNTIRLRPPRASLDGPAAAVGPQGNVITAIDMHQTYHSKLGELQGRIERDTVKRKDPNWEDVTEGPSQPWSTPLPLKHFRTIQISTGEPQSPPAFASGSRGGRSGVAMRARVGRGGRIVLDRKMSSPRQPSGVSVDNLGKSFLARPSAYSSSSRTSSEEDVEHAWRMESQWRYDADAGVVVGGAGLGGDLVGESDDNRLIIDDYEHNTFVVRKTLLSEDDFLVTLRTDEAHFARVTEARQLRKEEELVKTQKALALAEQVRREAAARAPPPQPAAAPAAVNGIPIAGSPSPAMVAQLKKVQQRQAMRPHPLAMNAAAAAAVAAGQQPQQASPISPNGMQKPATPVPSVQTPVQAAFANGAAHLQPPPVPRQSQSPSLVDVQASPEARPKSQPNGLAAPVNGHVPVPLSVPTNAAFPNITMQMQMRANGMMMNGMQIPANMMNGLSSQQAMVLKNLNATFPPNMGNPGNMALKLPAQRAMQLAAAAKEQSPPNGAGNVKAAVTGRASPANMNGILPHHPTSSPSPRITHAQSPHQQAVGGPASGHINGY